MFLLEEHRLAEGQIYGERASKEAVAAMARGAVRFLVRQIDGEPAGDLQSLSAPRFIERGSTAPPAGDRLADRG